MVGLVVHDFCRRLAGDGIVELVLHHGIEIFRHRRIAVIVDTALCKNIRHLLPDPALAGTDGSDTLQQFAEVVLTESILALLQAFVVQNKTLGHVLFEDASSPDAELRCPAGVDPVANRNDGIKIIEIRFFRLRFIVQRPVMSGCFHFGNNHFFIQLALFKNILQVLADCRLLHPEQFCHALLRQPNALILHNGVDRNIFFCRAVNQKLKVVFHFILLTPPSASSPWLCPRCGYRSAPGRSRPWGARRAFLLSQHFQKSILCNDLNRSTLFHELFGFFPVDCFTFG